MSIAAEHRGLTTDTAPRPGLRARGRLAHVLQVHNYYQQSGGEDSVVAGEAALLADHGHKVTQYAVHNGSIGSLSDKLRVFRDIAYSRTELKAFRDRLSVVKPDVVHVHNFFPLLTTSIYDACQDAGIPIVQTLHNFRTVCAGAYLLRDGKVCDWCLEGSPFWGVYHRCYRGSAAGSLAVAHMIASNHRRGTWHTKVQRFIALTDSGKEIFVRAGFPAERIAVKPNFAHDRGAPPDIARSGALYVGRLSDEKGITEIISAWQHIDCPLRVVGEGPLADALKSAAPRNVTFLGRLDADGVRREMTAAGMLVAVSKCLEGFPVVLAEALGAGLPVLASDSGAPRDIIRHGETGLHVPAGDTQSLASAVSSLSADPARLKAMSRAARAEYLEKYTPDANYSALRSIYEASICGS